MNKKSLPWIFGILFCIAAAVNLYGKLTYNESLASLAKPFLMPFLALTALFTLLPTAAPRKTIVLLMCALAFGWAGDCLLIPEGLLTFGAGILCFLIGHIFYLCIFSEAWKGLKTWQWIAAIVVMAAAVLALMKVIGVEGILFWPFFIYGSALMMQIFTSVCGLGRIGGTRWLLSSCGAVLFTFSDSLIATESFGTFPFAQKPFLIMLTYLAAQVLLVSGVVMKWKTTSRRAGASA